MSSSSSKQTILIRDPASTFQKAKVDLNKSDFEALIENKGYNVWVDKAIKCPCKTKMSDSRTDCVNCAGSGWIFVDRTLSKLILQSMDIATNFENWSELNAGHAKVTGRDVEALGYMDRITAIDASAITSQVIFFNKLGEGLIVGRVIYEASTIIDAFMFDGADVKLRRVVEGASGDFTINGNIITLNEKYNNIPEEDLRMSIRYSHAPQFHVVDLPREVMVTRIKNRSIDKEEDKKMPSYAIARRSHYLLDELNYTETNIVDNSAPIV